MAGISLVAYTEVDGRVFVKIPNEQGRYFLTDRCVVEVNCRYCGALVGEPCYSKEREGYRKYTSGTHWKRRADGQIKQKQDSPL